MDDSSRQVSQIQALENGKGIQYIIDEAYKILGNPSVLFNMEYELLSCAKNVVTDDRFWNEIVDKGAFCEESIRFFLDECFIDEVANSKTTALLASDKLKYERMYGRVFNIYNNTVADLITVACDKPFMKEDAMVFESICDKMSQEIKNSEFFKRYGILYHEKLICKLLDDDIKEKVIYSGHLSNLYEDLKTNLYVVVADFSECRAVENGLEGFRDLFKEMQPELKYAVYSNYIVIIASNDEMELNEKKDLYRLSDCFRDNSIRTGISGCFENLFDLRNNYNDAVDSLKKAGIKTRDR